MPHIKCVHITECRTESAAMSFVEDASAAGLDGIDFIADANVVTSAVVTKSHSMGLLCIVWVCRELPESDTVVTWETMLEKEVDMFTSDLPEAIFPWLSAKSLL